MEDAEAGGVLKFLLDTNVLSELRKDRPHGAVLAWFRAYPNSAFAIPSIAIFEIQMGCAKVRKSDPVRARDFEEWTDKIIASSTVLALDAESAREAARLLEKKPVQLMADAMIAAIARTQGLTIATRNVKDFAKFDVPYVNPFEV
jgi:toxin FitB